MRSAPPMQWILPMDHFTVSRGFIPASRGRDTHRGIDFAAPEGTPIHAAAAGRVILAGWGQSGYGRWVVIDHGDGVRSLYAHCSRTLVSRGDRVEAGQLIAEVGTTGRSTGPHLHFEIRRDNRAIDPAPLLGMD